MELQSLTPMTLRRLSDWSLKDSDNRVMSVLLIHTWLTRGYPTQRGNSRLRAAALAGGAATDGQEIPGLKNVIKLLQSINLYQHINRVGPVCFHRVAGFCWARPGFAHSLHTFVQ